MPDRYDLIVLGGGPAGYPAAIRAAQLGARVCLVERGPLGGVCLNWGCIPTKTLHAAAHLLELAAGGGGVAGTLSVDPAALLDHKGSVVSSLVGGVEKLLKGRKIDLVRGEGRLAGPGTVDVEGHGALHAASIIVATGSSEASLPGMAFDGTHILSSTDLLDLGRIPASMLVVGGGVIGCEFASIFNAFGTKVTIVEMLPSLIATEDLHVVRFLQTFLKKKGIALHLGTKVTSLETGAPGVLATLEGGGTVEAEIALVSVGRRPNIAGIGLEEAGVGTTRAGITVDPHMRTGSEGIYAAGDVVGGWLLAHVATREGVVAAANALGGGETVDYSAVPVTIYTLPEIARVGLTEQDAKAKGIETAVGRFPFAANGKAKGLREEDGFVKWVAEKDGGRLLGLHVIGPQATELLGAGILSVQRGLTAHDLAQAIFPHPTLSEALGEAAEAVEGRAIHLL
jgi:dihydrolipoamide dehydrogenase